ncbi:hypothetical protein Mucpa_2498 [Mucilaginibacter paludis DSM 18603]|uniref:Uncharacterized protein n=1 Tax=Mucilaginibacter paludis DSM 18603 TaxID=714943 RepID=H1XZG9_9SPHI|nr:hypothetical protein Mucpa_2498 [Mucilaginibacter paludis DSM 18603]
MERTKDAWFNYSDAIELMPLQTTLSLSKSQRLFEYRPIYPP